MLARDYPLRVLLLASEDHWLVSLRACVQALQGQVQLISAPSWSAACALCVDEDLSPLAQVLLATPALQPPAGRCSLPLIQLLEADQPPPVQGDWLYRKELSASLLQRSLQHVVERHALSRRLQQLTEQDALTGIANRQGFHRLLGLRLAAAPGQVLLGFLDLDNFRYANDSLGQQAGDRLIQQVVARLSSQLQPGEQLARLGGDEFALLLQGGADSQRAQQLAEQITAQLAEPYWLDGETLLLGCSLGLAQARAGQSADQLLWHAQLAMQQAKVSQGCTYQLYDERSVLGRRSQAERESELRRALRRDELQLHYQPRLCLHSQQVVGLEALVRWQHPELGLLGPDQFVPLAEESGMIVPLGYWVMARAMRDMQWLLGRGLAPLHMAVNLSFRQFQDSQLLATLRRLLDERGVDARWLEFELTETAVMRRSDQVRQTMDALGELGVRFALDDFGTGFSSFQHLASLPIALLKIDKGFVAGLQEHAEKRRLLQAMINLAHNLDLQVVAEGVELPAQLELLRQFGCDQVQGYLISRALPLPELARFLVFRPRQGLASV